MLTLLLLSIQDYVLRDLKVSPVASYGAFRLSRGDCVERVPAVAVLHWASCVPGASLIWSSADGAVRVVYADDGALLTRSFAYPLRLDPPYGCGAGGTITPYRPRPGSAADWKLGAKPLGTVLARCSLMEAARIRAYQNEFIAAAADYERAVTGLRTLASSMFNGLRRCAELRNPPRHEEYKGATCVRYEG